MPMADEPTINATKGRSGAAALMPRPVRRIVLLVLGGIIAGALAIVLARGPAMLIDLAVSAGRWLCL